MAGAGLARADDLPQGPNQCWSLDFVADQLVDGRRFRVLVVVGDFTRECLALVVDTSLSGIRVASGHDTLIGARGKPLMIVSDNGTDLTPLPIGGGTLTVENWRDRSDAGDQYGAQRRQTAKFDPQWRIADGAD